MTFRWLPNLWTESSFQSGEFSRQVHSAIVKATAKPRQPMSTVEREALMRVYALKGVNTSISRYVWLPITFEAGRPVIHWRDEWSLDDFPDA